MTTKLDPVQFAKLCLGIQSAANATLTISLVDDIHSILVQNIPTPERSPLPTHKFHSSEQDFRELFLALAHNRKLDAIRVFRSMTGFDLKDGKDALESLCAKYTVKAL